VQYAFDLYGLKFTLEEAAELRNKFFKAYPGIKRYHDMVGKKMQKGNYICQPALGYKMKPKIYTDALNGPTQGTGAECMRLAIHLLIKKDERAIDKIINSIHDALYLEIDVDEVEYWKRLIEESMIEAWNEIRKSSLFHFRNTPMVVEAEVGYNLKYVGPDLEHLEVQFTGGGSALSLEEMKETQERNKKC
jgi:DNA polymerase I-like protein with 3'-5' exonuclease and polymerase domains